MKLPSIRAVVIALAVGAASVGVGVAVGASTGAFSETAATTTSTTTSTTTTTTSTTTTTTAPPPPTTTTTSTVPATTAPPVVSFRRGDEGPEVVALQERLAELGYWLPSIDGTYGSNTAQAVMAFQKVEGLGRDGVAGPQTLAALDTAVRPTPRDGSVDGVEIDLARQVLVVVRAGEVAEVFNTSTGKSGWRTPPGTFTVTRQIDGMRNAPLGQLWRPKYFNRGIAMHGSGSIPGYAASHGCARLSNAAINHLWDDNLVPVGTSVSVF